MPPKSFCITGVYLNPTTWGISIYVTLEELFFCFVMHVVVHLYQDVLNNYSLTGSFCDSELHDTSMHRTSCMCGLIGNDDSVLSFVYTFGKTIGSCIGVSLGSSIRSVVKHSLPLKKLMVFFVLGPYFCLYPPSKPFHFVPHLCIWEGRQSGNIKLAFWIVLSVSKLSWVDWPWLFLIFVRLIPWWLYCIPLYWITLPCLFLDSPLIWWRWKQSRLLKLCHKQSI